MRKSREAGNKPLMIRLNHWKFSSVLPTFQRHTLAFDPGFRKKRA